MATKQPGIVINVKYNGGVDLLGHAFEHGVRSYRFAVPEPSYSVGHDAEYSGRGVVAR